MLYKRIITAMVAFPLALLTLVYGPPWFLISLLLIFATLSTVEVMQIIFPKLNLLTTLDGGKGQPGQKVPVWIKWVGVIAGGAIFLIPILVGNQYFMHILISVFLLLCILGMFGANDPQVAVCLILALVVSVLYGTLSWLAVWGLYEMYPRGSGVIFVLFVVVCSDTGGYFGGRLLGRHKLAPRLSPNKTVEGALVGLSLAVLSGGITNHFFGNSFGSLPVALGAAFVGSCFCQLGDLVESAFKRFGGVKDSGAIFPGHGGFLDRVDGLLFAAPAIWLIFSFATV